MPLRSSAACFSAVSLPAWSWASWGCTPCGPCGAAATRAPPSTCSTRYSRRSSCTCSPNGSAPLAFWLWWPRASSWPIAPSASPPPPSPSASWCPAASGASSCSSSTRWCSFFWVCSCPRPSRRPLPTTSRCRFFWGWWPWSRHLSWGAASGGCSSWRRSIASAVVAAGAARCGRRRRRWKRWRRTSLRPRRTCAIAAPIGASASAAC